MPYVAAKNWKGQTLPPGALGYPRSHPNVYSYARPRYFKGRGFSGLGQASNTCTIANTPGCSWSDSLWLSSACQNALDACTYGTGPGSVTTLNLATPPGAGSLPTAALVAAQTDPASAVAAQTTAAAQALQAVQASNAAVNACPAGYVAQSNGTCAVPGSGVPSWVWYAAGGVAATLLLLAVSK